MFILLKDMEPNGIIYRKEGETVEITCTLIDSKNYSISDLEFTYRRNSPKISSEKTETIVSFIKQIHLFELKLYSYNLVRDCVSRR